jgi:hypothetical protein
MDKYTVRDSNGSVDVAASANAYAAALANWVVENETPTADIEAAVEAVFDQHPKLTMPTLLSHVVHELGATPEQFKALTERSGAYVRGQATLGRLEITKGKGGGVARLARPGEPIPAKPAKTA